MKGREHLNRPERGQEGECGKVLLRTWGGERMNKKAIFPWVGKREKRALVPSEPQSGFGSKSEIRPPCWLRVDWPGTEAVSGRPEDRLLFLCQHSGCRW